MKEHNINNTQNHDTRYNVVHPQCRGYVHKTALLFHFLQNNSSDLRTQQQIRPSSLTAHLAAVPFLQSLSCALSCSSFLKISKLRTQLQFLSYNL